MTNKHPWTNTAIRQVLKRAATSRLIATSKGVSMGTDTGWIVCKTIRRSVSEKGIMAPERLVARPFFKCRRKRGSCSGADSSSAAPLSIRGLEYHLAAAMNQGCAHVSGAEHRLQQGVEIFGTKTCQDHPGEGSLLIEQDFRDIYDIFNNLGLNDKQPAFLTVGHLVLGI